MHARADRIRNLEMADGTFGPDAAGLDRSAKRRRERNPGRGERVVVRAYFRTRSPTSGSAAPTYRLPARPGRGRVCTRAQITHVCVP